MPNEIRLPSFLPVISAFQNPKSMTVITYFLDIIEERILHYDRPRGFAAMT